MAQKVINFRGNGAQLPDEIFEVYESLGMAVPSYFDRKWLDVDPDDGRLIISSLGKTTWRQMQVLRESEKSNGITMLFRFKFMAMCGTTYNNIGAGVMWRSDNTGNSLLYNGYYLTRACGTPQTWPGAALYASCYRRDADSQTSVNQNTVRFDDPGSFSNVVDAPFSVIGVRAQASDNATSLFAYDWAGSYETAYYTSTFSAYHAANQYAGILLHDYGSRVKLDQIAIGTNDDLAPNFEPDSDFTDRTVSGILQTPTGDPADGYIARIYERYSGALMGEMLTNSLGAFSFVIPASAASRFTVVGVDQLGNTWQAPIKDLIIGIEP